MPDRIDIDVINALIAGHLRILFVLGMHKTTAGLEVRALLPRYRCVGDRTENRAQTRKTGVSRLTGIL